MNRGRLRIAVLGLTLSSSWGNGHATTYRALLRALAERGHDILFLERDMPWYAKSRDLAKPDYCRLALYGSLGGLGTYRAALAGADAVIVGSFVPDGIAVGRFVQAVARGVKAFYDIDTPVTLEALEQGTCEYLSGDLMPGWELYLSFTGGATLERLERHWGVPIARPLYCSVDARRYAPVVATQRWDLSYLGTYSPDRQPVIERLLLEPARRAPHRKFAVAGPQYPKSIAWPANVERIEHVAPQDHPAFYCASRFTLNATRAHMVRAGYSPSVRLFEAAATETPIISDVWDGIETILRPGQEIHLARGAEDVLSALLEWPDARRRKMAASARQKVLSRHTATHRAIELELYLNRIMHRRAGRRRPLAVAHGSPLHVGQRGEG